MRREARSHSSMKARPTGERGPPAAPLTSLAMQIICDIEKARPSARPLVGSATSMSVTDKVEVEAESSAAAPRGVSPEADSQSTSSSTGLNCVPRLLPKKKSKRELKDPDDDDEVVKKDEQSDWMLAKVDRARAETALAKSKTEVAEKKARLLELMIQERQSRLGQVIGEVSGTINANTDDGDSFVLYLA